jgi:hypothetical protein
VSQIAESLQSGNGEVTDWPYGKRQAVHRSYAKEDEAMILHLETPTPESALCRRLSVARMGFRSALTSPNQPTLHDRVIAQYGRLPAAPFVSMPYQKKHFWQRAGL